MNRFVLPLPPGFRPGPALAYHGRDAQSPCERVEGTTLWKALVLGGVPAVLRLEIGPAEAVGEVDAGGAAAEAARTAAARMLGLVHDPAALEARAEAEPDVARLVGDRRGLRLPLAPSLFEAVSWAIIGQQINLTFAATLRRELILLAGRPHPSGMIAHPLPSDVAVLDREALLARRFSRQKADYLIGLSRAVADGSLDLEGLRELDPEEAAARLTALKGIGPWTAQYVLLRGCGFPDCVPAGDAGLAAALQRFHGMDRRPTPEEQKRLMEPFAPWRSLATAHLWASLG